MSYIQVPTVSIGLGVAKHIHFWSGAGLAYNPCDFETQLLHRSCFS
jgi:hypothetical protein